MKKKIKRTVINRTNNKGRVKFWKFSGSSKGYIRLPVTNRSKKISKLFSTKLRTVSTLVFCLIFAVIGLILLRVSQAAGVNANDEILQYYDINQTRKGVGQVPIQISNCLNQKARDWSKTMATTVDSKGNHLRHSDLGPIVNSCGPGSSNVGQNVAVAGPVCDGTLRCSQAIYNAFTSPTEIYNCVNKIDDSNHYCNIIADFTYVGVGSYRDDSARLWITHDFLRCTGCGLQTYNPTYWTLEGGVTASSSGVARAQDINVKRGATINWYHDVKNNGPVTAVFNQHENYYRYNKAGTLLASGLVHSSVADIRWGITFLYKSTSTVPSNASIGDRYCHRIWYDEAAGPNTGPEVRPVPPNASCATVVL